MLRKSKLLKKSKDNENVSHVSRVSNVLYMLYQQLSNILFDGKYYLSAKNKFLSIETDLFQCCLYRHVLNEVCRVICQR